MTLRARQGFFFLFFLFFLLLTYSKCSIITSLGSFVMIRETSIFVFTSSPRACNDLRCFSIESYLVRKADVLLEEAGISMRLV